MNGSPSSTEAQCPAKRLAIVGCGSSGLVTLKYALEFLPDWEVVAFEKSDSITGCWGFPYQGFVSTSTKFTTQFACHPVWKAVMHDDAGESRCEFFRDGEYGDYLESFAGRFQLMPHIRLNQHVERVNRDDGGWTLEANGNLERFDAVVICTGLAASPKPLDTSVPRLTAQDLNRQDGSLAIRQKTVVVVGGGESAVDFANRLARREFGNRVVLSLHSGVRVSPRYHPIRGVPSDFLRNRWMLTADPDVRNFVGEVFVRLRIRYQAWFERLFPGQQRKLGACSDQQQIRGYWTMQLTRAAKGDVFNMFHNKSDDFLEAVGDGRIQIVGPAKDRDFAEFEPFVTETGEEGVTLQPDYVVPAVGYMPTLSQLLGDQYSLTEFYLGCCHQQDPTLFLVGFARPVIGNIPSIAEMQARYVCGLLAGDVQRPGDMHARHVADQQGIQARYKGLNLNAMYPVEMFPYCDELARQMGLTIGPRWFRDPVRWLRVYLSPASTLHYFDEDQTAREFFQSARIYMPWTLILIILCIRPFDWCYRWARAVVGSRRP